MYILMISRGVPTPQDPQWGCFEKDQAEALASLGHKIVVTSVDSRFRLRWRHLGITHYHINNIDYYNSFWIPGIITKLFGKKINEKIKEVQLENIYKIIIKRHGIPDVIYGQYFFNSYLGLSLAKRYNIPLINIEHAGRFLMKDIDSESMFQANAIYKYTSANIVVSNSLGKALQQLFRIKTQTVYNMYGREFEYHKIDKHQNNKLIFISVGSLLQIKRHDLLINALAKANLPKDKWELNIIGEGACHSLLLKQISNLGFENNIHLLGQKNKQEIVSFLNNSDIFILSSDFETFSVVCIEAMACGLPVIATRCGGPEEFVTDKNGLLVPVDNVDKLAEAIKYMFHHYQEYDRKAIADNCQARFSSKVIAKQLTRIFEDVVAKYSTNSTN